MHADDEQFAHGIVKLLFRIFRDAIELNQYCYTEITKRSIAIMQSALDKASSAVYEFKINLASSPRNLSTLW